MKHEIRNIRVFSGKRLVCYITENSRFEEDATQQEMLLIQRMRKNIECCKSKERILRNDIRIFKKLGYHIADEIFQFELGGLLELVVKNSKQSELEHTIPGPAIQYAEKYGIEKDQVFKLIQQELEFRNALEDSHENN